MAAHLRSHERGLSPGGGGGGGAPPGPRPRRGGGGGGGVGWGRGGGGPREETGNTRHQQLVERLTVIA
ncbi:hypothetical protein, partial [Nocardia cyriacigeorgica]|uniref:hypothetical protein n=1 Tax=Nocardia cyriacigeorgica TaxID=135487 RepID=UPI00245761ED